MNSSNGPEPAWRQLRLSLERPYKDDNGNPLPRLFDITPEGSQVFEPQDDLETKLSGDLRRIFQERGHNFFEKTAKERQLTASYLNDSEKGKEEENKDTPPEESTVKPMTPDELLKMRQEIMPSLHVALGEMMLARDLLALLLASRDSTSTASLLVPPANISTTATDVSRPALREAIVSNLPPTTSVKAFNAQLDLGGKDEALRRASSIFKRTAESMDRSITRSERYWADALKVRRGNWGLRPAPLPAGTNLGRGVDRSARDFMISFGLEESPTSFRQSATGHLAREVGHSPSTSIVCPMYRQGRLHISIRVKKVDTTHVYHNVIQSDTGSTLSEHLATIKTDIVEQEIFNEIIKEAGNLPSAAARVSERLVSLEVADDVDLELELIEPESLNSSPSADPMGSAICDLLYHAFHILLLRIHAYRKRLRLGSKGTSHSDKALPQPPPLLLPVIDLLQYKVFCDRVKTELDRMLEALTKAGIPSRLRLDVIGESGEQLVDFLHGRLSAPLTGGAVLRIDGRQTLQFAFVSPSMLTVHLPESSLLITSVHQLRQLLVDEVKHGLLEKIKEIGAQMTVDLSGSWFVDLLTGCTVGRWMDRTVTFRIHCSTNFDLGCSVSRATRQNVGVQVMPGFPMAEGDQSLFGFVEAVILKLI